MTQRILDRHARVFTYLRVAVTEQCNLRCVYCMPAEGMPFKRGDQLLGDEEIVRVIRVLATVGVNKVRFTGGEPLVRKGIASLVESAAKTPGIETVHLTTNGVLLKDHARALRDAGLTGINISLDTLRADRFEKLTRRQALNEVLANIEHAVSVKFPSVKMNVVVLRTFNDDELLEFARLTQSLPVTVRFIELMPFDARQIWKQGKFYSAERILNDVRSAFPQLELTQGSSTEHHSYRLPDALGKIAIIPAYSRTLCANCDRIRLTADGNILNCLYSEREFGLRERLREGCSDDDLVQLFQRAMGEKLIDGWAAQKEAERHKRTSMTQIGG